MPESTLKISLGQFSKTGLRERNEDFYGCVTPSNSLTLENKGISAIIADGVGDTFGGKEASQYTVGGFFTDYYSTPDSWEIDYAANQVLRSINSWLYSQGQKAINVNGLVTTFSMVIFCGCRAYIFHIGDSRIYHFRDAQLTCLTKDHHSPHSGHLIRALGIDSNVQMDFHCIIVEKDDHFLMTTDGVHGYLEKNALKEILESERGLQSKAELMTTHAFEAGSPDNLTAQIIRLDSLPLASCQELNDKVKYLQFPPLLERGDILDEYHIEGDLATGGMGCLYLATNSFTSEPVVLKCPSLQYEGDPLFLERFLREEWVGRRVHSPHLMKVFPSHVQPRQYLYLVMEFCPGVSIRQKIENKYRFTLDETIEIGKQLCRGLTSLHRLKIIHRDLKPDNILVTPEGAVKIVDYGIALLPALKTLAQEEKPPGSPCYMAPELFRGTAGAEQSDIFGLGVTLYEMLTGDYPYGEIDESGNYAKKEYKPLSAIRDDIPSWLDTILQKATHKKCEHRYEAPSEILYFLENPDAVPTLSPFIPLIEKDPIFFWKLCSIILLMTNIIMIMLLMKVF